LSSQILKQVHIYTRTHERCRTHALPLQACDLTELPNFHTCHAHMGAIRRSASQRPCQYASWRSKAPASPPATLLRPVAAPPSSPAPPALPWHAAAPPSPPARPILSRSLGTTRKSSLARTALGGLAGQRCGAECRRAALEAAASAPAAPDRRHARAPAAASAGWTRCGRGAGEGRPSWGSAAASPHPSLAAAAGRAAERRAACALRGFLALRMRGPSAAEAYTPGSRPVT
jgi:hypothetical protein